MVALLEDLKYLDVGSLNGKVKILNGAPLNKTNIKDKSITSKFQSGLVLKETDTNVIVSNDLVGHVYSLDKKYFNDYTVGESYRERLIKMFQILICKDDKERRNIAKGDEFLMGLIRAIERYLYEKETREMKNFPDKWRMEGRAEGRTEEKMQIAKNLLSQNIDFSTIMKSTGLSRQELNKIAMR